MNTPPTRKQVTHDRIVATAARAIRRFGFQGMGVADIMKEAGLTHGGFYAHFPSRDALICEAIERAGQESAARIAKLASTRETQGISAFRAFVENYLSDRHLSSAESGCPVAALASEMPRQPRSVAQAATRRVRNLIAAVGAALPRTAPKNAAGPVASQLIGALQLARALGDNAEGKALLSATRRMLLDQFDAPHH